MNSAPTVPIACQDLTPSPLSHKERGLKMNTHLTVHIRKNHVNQGNHINQGSDKLRKRNVKMNSPPTIPIANQTRCYPPRTRTSFLSIANPMDRDLNTMVFMGTNKKEAKNSLRPRNAGKNPFTIRKDRPENSRTLRQFRA